MSREVRPRQVAGNREQGDTERGIQKHAGHPARSHGATRITPGAMPGASMTPPLRGRDHLSPGHSPARRGVCGQSDVPKRAASCPRGIPPDWSTAPRRSRTGRCPVPAIAPPLRGWDYLAPGPSPPASGGQGEIGNTAHRRSTKHVALAPPRTGRAPARGKALRYEPPPAVPPRLCVSVARIPTARSFRRRRRCGNGPASARATVPLTSTRFS